MSDDLGAFSCRGCGGPLRYGLTGFSCVTGQIVRRDPPAGLRAGIDCTGKRRVIPRPQARVVDVFRCSGCRREEKHRPDEPLPNRDCACGGMLVYNRTQTR